MITEAILNVVFSFFTVLVDVLPTFETPFDLASAFTQISGWIAWVNYYLPVGDIVSYAVALLGVWLACALVAFVLQIF